MPTNAEYEAAIKRLRWPGLTKLWNSIKDRSTEWWEPGKAFEYLVLRMLDLDKAQIRWPYSVSLFGQDEVEQIDGSVRIGSLYCLVECKDEAGNINVVPIAKLRNQLSRRPGGTVGLLFSTHAFTGAAILLAHFALPHAILLWTRDEIERALNEKRICSYVEEKFRMCVDEGMPDYTIAAIADRGSP